MDYYQYQGCKKKLSILEQNLLIPYALGFDDSKVFKEKLGIITSVQVCGTK